MEKVCGFSTPRSAPTVLCLESHLAPFVIMVRKKESILADFTAQAKQGGTNMNMHTYAKSCSIMKMIISLRDDMLRMQRFRYYVECQDEANNVNVSYCEDIVELFKQTMVRRMQKEIAKLEAEFNNL